MAARIEPSFALLSLSVCLAVSAGSLAGCVTKSKADAQARAAYLAGQQAAFMQLREQPRPELSVTFVGPVNHPNVKWLPGLMLSQAILNAGYSVPTDPKSIVIRRNGGEIPFDPKRLLAGEDFPLQPGDVVELRQ